MNNLENNIDQFFAYARERYQILLRRQSGMVKPWTNDSILLQYRFCNIFREDDTTTQWFRTHVRDPYEHSAKVLGATIIFRWFNRIETGQKLLEQNLLTSWDSEVARRVLGGVSPLVTGAYMIKTPAKMNKLEGLICCIERALPVAEAINFYLNACQTPPLQFIHEWLKDGIPYVGSFMAYEIITDLRHTSLLRDAPDIMTWANAGPGAARGMGRLENNDSGMYNYQRECDQDALQEGMQQLLKYSQQNQYWLSEWPAWEMREVEHTLCEYDKYMRAKLGQGRPKQRYKGGI